MGLSIQRVGAIFVAAGLLLLGKPVAAAEDVPVHFATVQTPHGTLRIAVREEGKGRPILLLHGLGTSGYTWRALIPVLAKDHRVIAIDLRGFGSSDKPHDTYYSIKDQMEVVKAFIIQQDLRDL